MVNKETYRNFCQENNTIPIFMQDWWLDVVCGDDWKVLIMQENDRILALMPFHIHKKYIFKSIIPPHLTPIGGVWIIYENGMSQTSRYSHEIKVMDYIGKEIDKLKIDLYFQKYNHTITNWIGLYWLGFKQTTYYTYRVLGLENLEEVYSLFHQKTKKSIRLAEEDLIITEDISLEEFYRINSLTFERQRVKVPYSESFFIKLASTCKEKNACKLLAAKDKAGRIHAVLMIVFNQNTCYSIVSGADPTLRSSGATTLLNWHAIQFAHHSGMQEYDFTGSMIEPVEKFFRHFGAVQTPYFVIEKHYSKLYTLIRSLKK